MTSNLKTRLEKARWLLADLPDDGWEQLGDLFASWPLNGGLQVGLDYTKGHLIAGDLGFWITTEDQLGFRRGGMSWAIGMSGKACLAALKKCGCEVSLVMAGKKDPEYYLNGSKTHHYQDDGLMVTCRGGELIGIIFYFMPSKQLEPCQALTEAGIGIGITPEQLVARLGEPDRESSFVSAPDWDERKLFYLHGELVVTYIFDQGRFQSIGFNKYYLPFLPKA